MKKLLLMIASAALLFACGKDDVQVDATSQGDNATTATKSLKSVRITLVVKDKGGIEGDLVTCGIPAIEFYDANGNFLTSENVSDYIFADPTGDSMTIFDGSIDVPGEVAYVVFAGVFFEYYDNLDAGPFYVRFAPNISHSWSQVKSQGVGFSSIDTGGGLFLPVDMTLDTRIRVDENIYFNPYALNNYDYDIKILLNPLSENNFFNFHHKLDQINETNVSSETWFAVWEIDLLKDNYSLLLPNDSVQPSIFSISTDVAPGYFWRDFPAGAHFEKDFVSILGKKIGTDTGPDKIRMKFEDIMRGTKVYVYGDNDLLLGQATIPTVPNYENYVLEINLTPHQWQNNYTVEFKDRRYGQ